MRTLLKLALLIIGGLLVYNYFLGSEEEKATSEKVFKQVKEVGKSIGSLIKNERQKFADGKYDKAFENLGKMYEGLKEKVDKSDEEANAELDKLEQQKEKLQKEKESIEEELAKENPDEEILDRGKDLDEELRKLADETGRFFDKIMRKEK